VEVALGGTGVLVRVEVKVGIAPVVLVGMVVGTTTVPVLVRVALGATGVFVLVAVEVGGRVLVAVAVGRTGVLVAEGPVVEVGVADPGMGVGVGVP
jgi:hypothetical protein